MKRFSTMRAATLLCAALAVLAAIPSPPQAQTAPKRKMMYDGIPDTGQFLPDSFVIARVGERKVTVWQFRDGYYAIYPTMRPRPDSLGRVEFLGNIVRKEILAQVAIKANRPFDFTDRADVRQYGNRLLGNILFKHEVDDSLNLSEPELKRIYAFYGYDLRMRHLFFTDRELAERTRLKLLRGQLAWGAAQAAYGLRDTSGKSVATETQWMRFETLPPDIGVQIWPLRVGEYSPLLLTPGGYHLVQIVDSRKRTEKPSFDGLRGSLEIVLRQVQTRRLRKKVQAEAMAGFDLAIDSAVVRTAASKFNASMQVANDGFATSFTVDASVPEYSLDEQRLVLARWNARKDSLTIANAVHAYSDLPIMGRPSLNTPEDMTEFVLNVVLEPRLVDVAIRRGLDKDSTYLALMVRKREEIMVTHMVEDSVFSKISITNEDRHRYYEAHLQDFKTYPSVHYALVLAPTRAVGDSMKAVFDKGGDPAAIVASFQKKYGEDQAKVDDEAQNAPTFLHKNLFEELKPGKSTVNGSDPKGKCYVVKSIAFDEGHVLPYEQAQQYVEESVQNVASETALEAFVERHRKTYRIETHPEKVMKIRLVDTTDD